MNKDTDLPVLHSHTAWAPLRWPAINEQMVALHCRGISNKDIAEMLGYNPVHIGRVINSTQGQEIATKYKDEIRKKLMETADLGMEVAQIAAAENIKTILSNKELAARQPFHMVRASMEFMKGMGKLKDDAVVKQAQNNQFNFFGNMDPALQKQLADGIEEAREVMRKDEIVVEQKAS